MNTSSNLKIASITPSQNKSSSKSPNSQGDLLDHSSPRQIIFQGLSQQMIQLQKSSNVKPPHFFKGDSQQKTDINLKSRSKLNKSVSGQLSTDRQQFLNAQNSSSMNDVSQYYIKNSGGAQRNAISFGYGIKSSLKSIEPLL